MRRHYSASPFMLMAAAVNNGHNVVRLSQHRFNKRTPMSSSRGSSTDVQWYHERDKCVRNTYKNVTTRPYEMRELTIEKVELLQLYNGHLFDGAGSGKRTQ